MKGRRLCRKLQKVMEMCCCCNNGIMNDLQLRKHSSLMLLDPFITLMSLLIVFMSVWLTNLTTPCRNSYLSNQFMLGNHLCNMLLKHTKPCPPPSDTLITFCMISALYNRLSPALCFLLAIHVLYSHSKAMLLQLASLSLCTTF